jgi:hypothetical protein
MKHVIITEVRDGKLTRNRKLITEVLQSFEGKTLQLTIERFRNKRSNAQNKYYWGLIIPIWRELIKNEWGEVWSKEDTHEFLKMNFGFEEVVDINTGEVLRKPQSTTVKTTTEMEEYHEVCRQKAHEMFGTVIPLPNEDLTLDL